MNTYLKNIFSRYKIEALLACFAVFIFFAIINQFIENQWDDPLRTMCFVLFGNLGLIGLALGFKRHEQSLKEHADLNEERRKEKESKKIFRMHECIQKIDNKTPFAVFVGVLAEIESFFQSLDEEKKEFVLKVLATYVQSDRLRTTGNSMVRDAEAVTKDEEVRDQNKKINLTFTLLHKLTDGKPISKLREHKIEEGIDLSGLEIKGETASLCGESFEDCNLAKVRFSNTSIINCNFPTPSADFTKIFREVEVDGTDFGHIFDGQIRDFYKNHESKLEEIKKYIYFTKNEPTNLVRDETIQKSLIEAMKK